MSSLFIPRTARPAPLRDARRRSTIKLLYGPGIAFPGLARLRDIVHMVCLYNIYTDTEPPRARPGPSRPSLASGGPPAAARCGGVTNPTTEHRDAVGRSEVQLGVCITHPGLSPGPINRRLRRRGHEVLFTPAQAFMQHSNSGKLRHTSEKKMFAASTLPLQRRGSRKRFLERHLTPSLARGGIKVKRLF